MRRKEVHQAESKLMAVLCSDQFEGMVDEDDPEALL
jgi:hypothetical protein